MHKNQDIEAKHNVHHNAHVETHGVIDKDSRTSEDRELTQEIKKQQNNSTKKSSKQGRQEKHYNEDNKNNKGNKNTEETHKNERVEALEKLVLEKDKEIKELIDNLKRLQAEFENYKKRVKKDTEALRNYERVELVKSLLPVLDSFELAIKNSRNLEHFKKGVELIYAQLHTILENIGLREIKTIGEKFNPEVHEALLLEESDKEKGIIIEELQKGYTLNNIVLRTAKVKVSKGTNNSTTNKKTKTN